MTVARINLISVGGTGLRPITPDARQSPIPQLSPLTLRPRDRV